MIRKTDCLVVFLTFGATLLQTDAVSPYWQTSHQSARGVWSFEDCSDSSVVGVDCTFVAIEEGDEVGYGPYHGKGFKLIDCIILIEWSQ